MWGRQLVGEEDVWKVFHNFITDTPNEDSGAKVSEYYASRHVFIFVMLFIGVQDDEHVNHLTFGHSDSIVIGLTYTALQ